MRAYRLYIYRKDGQLIGPALSIPADDDAGAVAEAEKRLGVLDAELRDAFRLVKKFVPEQLRSP
jgi:hypothetical protein